MIKRILDITLSLTFLIFFGWILVILIIISNIIHHSNGIYKQVRVGKNLKQFNLYKIKSMKSIEGYESLVTLKNDPRVTKYGNLLRKLKIDELPQIINVLLGDMSIVGPRPTVVEDTNLMNNKQLKRFEVRPGLTGLAQINGNTSLSWPKRIEYDIEYVNNQTIKLDLAIIFKTILLILTNKAETHPKYDDEWKE